MNQNFLARIEKDPFRLFFPMGATLAIAGVLPWVVQYFTHASYPRDLHRVLMIDGFSLAFVCGFLMTAIPRFTGSEIARGSEISVVFICLLVAGVGAFLPSQALSFLFSSLAITAELVFAGKRFIKRTSNPPYTFLFIGIGLTLWLFSNVMLFLNSIGMLENGGLLQISQDLFSNGAIMSLILGVGGRLIPGILGWQEIVSNQRERYEKSQPFLAVVPRGIWLAAVAFVGSFFLEPLLPLTLCLAVRAAVTVDFAIRYWAIGRPPATRSFLTWNLWISCWCMALGYVFPLIWGGLGVHVMHVLFVGGFSLMTLLIAMRVSFAHSPIGTGVEKTSWGIAVFSTLILLAMFTRATAILWPKIYLDHLGFAAMTWLAALLIWMSRMLKALRA